MARYIAEIVQRFIDFLHETEGDPLNPLSITITVSQAKQIDTYYKESLAIKDEEIRKLKEVIIKNEITKLT